MSADLITRLRWHARDRSNLYTSLTAEAADALEQAEKERDEAMDEERRYREGCCLDESCGAAKDRDRLTAALECIGDAAGTGASPGHIVRLAREALNPGEANQ